MSLQAHNRNRSMQNYSQPQSRNPSKAGDAKPGVVPAPSGKAPVPADQATGTGRKPGSSVPGFSGGVMPGKC